MSAYQCASNDVVKVERKRFNAICVTLNDLVNNVSTHESTLKTAVKHKVESLEADEAAAKEALAKELVKEEAANKSILRY